VRRDANNEYYSCSHIPPLCRGVVRCGTSDYYYNLRNNIVYYRLDILLLIPSHRLWDTHRGHGGLLNARLYFHKYNNNYNRNKTARKPRGGRSQYTSR